MSRRNRLPGSVEGRLGKAARVVESEHRVAIIRDIYFRERLPARRGETGKLGRLELAGAMDGKIVDHPLRALDNMHGYGDVSLLAPHIATHLGSDLDVAKSIRFIQVRDALFVPPPEGLAVAPVPQNQEPGGLHKHPLPDGIRVEIVIAGHAHSH